MNWVGGSRVASLLRCLVAALVFVLSNQARASSIQSDAPSVNPASPAWLDRAGFPISAGIALDQPLGNDDTSPALTLSSSPFALTALGDSKARRDPARFGGLSRIGVRLTLGGPTSQGNLPWFTRGQEETDHVTVELKLRVLGTGPERVLDSRVESPLLLSLALDADTYSTGFGRDLYAATLIMDSANPGGFTANVGYRQEEKLHHGYRDTEVKLAVGRNWRWHRVDALLGLGALVRDRDRKSVQVVNARLDAPVGGAFQLTASLFVSNLPERIEQRSVRASLGISRGM